jgi:hypothetical protein
MDDLIERLEKAPEGNLELSGRVWCARYGYESARYGYEFVEMRGNRVLYKPRSLPGCTWGHQLSRLENFATSQDAAVTLIPKDWSYRLNGTSPFIKSDDPNKIDQACCILISPEQSRTIGWAATLPLAISIAALRAYELMGEGGDNGRHG